MTRPSQASLLCMMKALEEIQLAATEYFHFSLLEIALLPLAQFPCKQEVLCVSLGALQTVSFDVFKTNSCIPTLAL